MEAKLFQRLCASMQELNEADKTGRPLTSRQVEVNGDLSLWVERLAEDLDGEKLLRKEWEDRQ